MSSAHPADAFAKYGLVLHSLDNTMGVVVRQNTRLLFFPLDVGRVDTSAGIIIEFRAYTKRLGMKLPRRLSRNHRLLSR